MKLIRKLLIDYKKKIQENLLGSLEFNNKILWLFILSVISPIIFGFYYIIHYAVNVPYWDLWDAVVPSTVNWYEGNFDFHRLISQWGDSRPIITNVIMLLISLLTRLDLKIMAYFGFTIYVISFILLLYFIKTDVKLDNHILILLIPLSFYIFNPYYMARFIENLGTLDYPIMIFSALITFYLIYRSKNSYLYYFSSIAMGVVCTFSFAAGLSIWFAGLVQLILQKMQRKWQKVAIWIASAAIIFFVYFFLLGFSSEGLHSTQAYSSFSMTALQYPISKFLCFMGAIGAEVIHDRQIALFFGLIILFATIALLYINRKFLDFDRLSKWYAILTFGMLTSLELALTRSGSESLLFGPPDNIYFIPDIRHSLAIFLPIICIYILAIIYAKNSILEVSVKGTKPHDLQAFFNDRKHMNIFLLGIIFSLILSGVVLHVMPGLNIGENIHNKMIENQNILQNYANMPDEALMRLHPNPATVRTWAAKLEQYKLNIFTNSYPNTDLLPNMNLLKFSKGGIMSIDTVNNRLYSNESEAVYLNKNTNKYIVFTGWAADDIVKDGTVKAYLVFRNGTEEGIVPTIKTIRPDIVKAFGVESYNHSGWSASVSSKGFDLKCYNISLRILRAKGGEYFELEGGKPICFS